MTTSRTGLLLTGVLAALLGLNPAPVMAQIVCNSATGPDVVVADLVVIKKWGTVGGITGYSIGSLACNIGDTPLEWFDNVNRHPVIAMNAYRMRNGRFEQIGMSWLKHGFYALANSDCCTCQDPNDSNYLGVGCSDAYDSNLNGNQAGFNGVAGLGPRSEVNPTTGEYPFPYGWQGQSGNAIYKRLQIHNSDLNPATNESALYFAELQYIAHDDAEAGNDLNNASYMPIQVGEPDNGGYPLSYAGPPRPTKPAIYAWREFDDTVTITPVDVPGDGRFFIAQKVTDLGNGSWHYEYAVFNLNSHRAARMFRIALPEGVNVSNIDFHDVDYHSGEPFDGTDWNGTESEGFVSWNTDIFDDNVNANALRWSTLYNFRFNADAPPGASTASLGLFRPGSPNLVNVPVAGPVPSGGGGPANDECADALDIGLGSTLFSNAGANTDGPDFPCAPAGGATHDVWFRFTPTFTGRTRISTCGSAAFNAIISVYEGCGCGESVLSDPIACNDDGCGSDAKVTLQVNAGQCYLIRVGGAGGETGVGTLKVACLDANNAVLADVVLNGEHAGDRFGQSVGFAGDFKNDGVDDVVVGSHLSDMQDINAGRALVRMGSSFTAVSGFSGEHAGDQFGRVVAGGSDYDGDGFDDILIGAPFNDDNGTDAGKVYCFSGFDDSLMWTVRGQAAGDRLGSAIACVDDVNGDDVDDALIGAPLNDIGGSNAGRAYLVAGQDGSVIHILPSNRPGAQFGAAVAELGDANGDGVGDFAVGAPRSNQGGASAGRVIVYSGADFTVLQTLIGGAGDRLGSSLAGVTMPVGAQTRTYLAVGAPKSSAAGSNSGQVRVFVRNHAQPKCPQLLCSTLTVNGQNSGDLFGAALDISDVVGGSAPELIVGAPGSDANGEASGSGFVVNSANGSILRRITGEAPGDALGTAAAVIGDINSDGKSDFVLGGPANDAVASNAGRAYIFLSQSATLLRAATGAGEDEGQELFVASVPGDADGDRDADADDLLQILRNWGRCRSGGCMGDVTGDGVVDAADVALTLVGRR